MNEAALTSVRYDAGFIDPLHVDDFDTRLLTFPNATIFHTQAWAKVLSDTYGYSPHYYMVGNSYSPDVLIPLMEVKSVLTGTRGVALPFSDYCAPLIRNKHWGDLIPALQQFGRERGWRTIELKGECNQLVSAEASSSYICHRINLDRSESDVFRSLRHSTRTNIRKAMRSDIRISFHNSAAAMQEYYRLCCINRKKRGLPPQPFQFFQNVLKHLVLPGKGEIGLAKLGNKVVSAAVFLTYGKRVVHKYFASDHNYQTHRGGNLLVWEAMQRYIAHRFTEYCFGRTALSNKGLLQYKRGWGGEEATLCYYRFDINSTKPVKSKISQFGAHNFVFSKMPIPLLKVVGKLMYRHVG